MKARLIAGCLALTFVLGIAAMSETGSGSAAKPAASLVGRGRYLVNDVGLCGDCHTPMDNRGRPVKGQYLQGAPIMFKPTVSVPGWMAIAPGIAGLSQWNDDQAIAFFMTGKKPDGAVSAPPMPAFRFNKADATAIVAYLKSLGTDAKGK